MEEQRVGRNESAGYPSVKGQVLDGKELWTLIEGLEANDLLHYTHLLTGACVSLSISTCWCIVQAIHFGCLPNGACLDQFKVGLT